MAMDKQTKQLAALGGLVLVAGVIAYFAFFSGGGSTSKPAGNGNVAVNTTATPTPNPGTTPTPKGGTTPTTTGPVAPVVAAQDLDIPAEEKIIRLEYEWPFNPAGKMFVPKPEKGLFPPFDPFLVQNIDVVDPQRREYIESLKKEWVLDGLIKTRQQMAVFDASGKQLIGDSITAPRPKTRPAIKLDKNGEPEFDTDGKVIVILEPVIEDGKPVYEQALDINGNPVPDVDGKPVYVEDILYVRVDADGKPLLDKTGKSVLDEFGVPLPEEDGLPKLAKDNKPIIIRNPGPGDKVKRLVKQVPEMEQVLERDGDNKVILDEKGKPKYKLKPVREKDKNGKEIPDGKIMLVDDKTPQTEIKLVLEATFQDKRRPYKETDRLTGTRFTILKIFQQRRYWNDTLTDFRVRAGVDLISDTGAPLTIFVTDDDRYTIEEAETKGK